MHILASLLLLFGFSISAFFEKMNQCPKRSFGVAHSKREFFFFFFSGFSFGFVYFCDLVISVLMFDVKKS